MHRLLIFILLQIVTLYSVSAHYHFVMDNAGEYTAETLSGQYIDDNIPDFECDDEFYADRHVFYEEMASTRRPDERFSVVEIGQLPAVSELPVHAALPAPAVYPRIWNGIPLIACYAFIVRLTPF